MINLTRNQAADADEICLSHELSGSTKSEAERHSAPDDERTEMIRLLHQDGIERAQLNAIRRIEASVHYMMQHLNKPMKVSTLSAAVGLSVSSFYPLFKCATGQTPLGFFIRARMCRAGEILEETTLQIKEVAAMLGYDDQFYFSRVFKSIHGVAPREYRLRRGESNARNHGLNPSNGKNSRHLHPWFPRSETPGADFVAGFQPAARRTGTVDRREWVADGGSGLSTINSQLSTNQTCSVPVHP